MKDKISNMFMFYVLYLYGIPLGIRVGNVVGKVVGMALMPSIPKSVLGHFCMIFLQNPDLDRGFNRPSIKGLTNTRSRVLLNPR